MAWRVGALVAWIWKLRKMNGPTFTWPLLLFASALPEWLMARLGKIYRGQPMVVKSRKELLATIKPQHWKHLRPDNGDLPDGWDAARESDLATPLFPVLGANASD
jgi:hypothetical protein